MYSKEFMIGLLARFEFTKYQEGQWGVWDREKLTAHASQSLSQVFDWAIEHNRRSHLLGNIPSE